MVSVAEQDDATGMVEVIHAAFGARPPLDPPSTASAETADSLTATLARGTGVYAEVGGRPAGVLLVVPTAPGVASFQRVSVHPDFQRHGIASALVHVAEELAARAGHRRVELFARSEFGQLITFWEHRGYRVDRPAPHGVVLAKDLPVVVVVPSGAAMQDLGERLASLLRPGDLLIATGGLGAGKTTLTQGLGRGLDTSGPVISPTFVLSRIHPPRGSGPALVHVDAYRLQSAEELDDLDLDATLADAVTVVEWGAGLAEGLAPDLLEIEIAVRPAPDADDDVRLVALHGVGPRWADVDLHALRGPRG
ncbi:tRNA threonylcarbamoyladenosine biosynthesis protein TsaE [Friedmanniella luteola]|uniref:tRNA threonylcarbamoyladenosine biosynthesis protein TsaE n=1 Tax=Friedmanniella luteola TaxID=546871 RepID=A0A1H1YV73_9ACTN|nr:tRNA threonylcarbamoyladenosine biosynthesis protein TsaE [Friedmanniella luteola]